MTSPPALARHHGVLLPHRSKEHTRSLESPAVTQDISASRTTESAIDALTMLVTSENQQLGGAPAVALVRDDNEHHVELVHHARPSILVHPTRDRLHYDHIAISTIGVPRVGGKSYKVSKRA